MNEKEVCYRQHSQQTEWEGILLGFNDTYRFGAHAIIVNSNNQVLLLKRTYGNKGWSLPGGGVDPGETIHQTLLRECHEELGVEVYNIVLTGFYYHSHINAQVGIFRCALPEDHVIKLSSEHSEYKWAQLDELSDSQRIRALDAIQYNGQINSRIF